MELDLVLFAPRETIADHVSKAAKNTPAREGPQCMYLQKDSDEFAQRSFGKT